MALIVLPVALTSLDGVELSLWLLLNSFMALALLADSGLSPTLLRAAAYYRSGADVLPMSFDGQSLVKTNSLSKMDPNWNGIYSLIATSRRMYGFVAIASLLLLGVFGLASVRNLMPGFRVSGHIGRKL